MPLILGTNSIKDTGFNVANSLRFNKGSSDYLSKNTATATNAKKFTYSVWVKRGVLNPTDDSTAQRLYQGYADTNNRLYIQFNYSAEVIRIFGKTGGTTEIYWDSTKKFRDVSAWYHIVMSADSTLSTQADRMKVYVNNELIDSWSKTNSPSQNIDWGNQIAQSNGTLTIGADNTTSELFDGYMAEACFIDGQALDPTSFGEFDEDSGIWKPINVSGLTFGTNGFYLDFENSGSLGADVSGNGNNFTVNNLTSIDQTTDTPTNNTNTHNSLIKDLPTLSEGNLNVTSRVGSTWETATGAIGVSQGKWYCEYKVITKSTALMFGVISMTEVNAVANGKHIGDTGLNSLGYGYNHQGTKYNNGNYSSYGDTFTTEDIIGIAMDLDNHKLYFSKNGTWQNSGDPESGATGTGSAYDLSTGYDYTFGASVNNGSDEAGGNFGNPAFTISSGNSDGNGYGNFEYSVPSGYYALNTKNLAEFG